jgi:RNA polymerase sigma-70 factor (TIGR02943 family)
MVSKAAATRAWFVFIDIVLTALSRVARAGLTHGCEVQDDASNGQAALHRGFPLNIVVAISRKERRVNARLARNPDFVGNFDDSCLFSVRGTPIALVAFIMTTTLDLTIDGEGRPACSSDCVDAHADYLFNFAIGQVRDSSVAEDVVQETFLAAVKARENFSGQSSERTWLVGILRHKICDHLRKACRERSVRQESATSNDPEALDESVLWLHDIAAESQSPSRRMELEEFRANLELALGKLPPRIAQVFQLYEIEERPNREVCEEMNISESNLWVMLHRARKQLRDQLGGWWFGETVHKTSQQRPTL